MPVSTVYTCRVTNWMMLGFNGLTSAVTMYNVVMVTGGWLLVVNAIVLPIAFVKAVLEASQRVSANPTGLTVRCGLFGHPRFTITRANITHAEITFLPFTARSSQGVFWLRKRGWFLTPRSGPALRLRLTSGRAVTVSVADPAAAMWAMGIAPYPVAHQPDQRLDKPTFGRTYGVGMVAPRCPRCAQPWGRFSPARTRVTVTHDIYICSACTIDEAVRAVAGHAALEPAAWPIAERIDPRSYC
ncbi:hypothetical protein [Nocardia inohanensis]|uniref:hypothetical protein n=1 Tax=Nocardia inohanensis TaxID=209246 RepID=UPI0008326A7E|nr:hypothetical protein [Nocardia inohanensis]